MDSAGIMGIARQFLKFKVLICDDATKEGWINARFKVAANCIWIIRERVDGMWWRSRRLRFNDACTHGELLSAGSGSHH
jgi:hypothetical protein